MLSLMDKAIHDFDAFAITPQYQQPSMTTPMSTEEVRKEAVDKVLMAPDWPWTKIENPIEDVQDDEDSFPTMDVWVVSVDDPKKLGSLHQYLKKVRPVEEDISHVKVIRKEFDPSGAVTKFQMIVSISSLPPSSLPSYCQAPERCTIPATSASTAEQLAAKNKLWPTVYTPHLQPKVITFTPEDVERGRMGFRAAVKVAIEAKDKGDLPIGAVVLGDQYIPEDIVAHDTRQSEQHPLRHAAINLIGILAEKTRQVEVSSAGTTGASTPLIPVITPTLDGTSSLLPLNANKSINSANGNSISSKEGLKNGDGYQLTNRSLYITHEPCLMCTMALVHARVKEVYYLHPMPATGGCGGVALVPGLKSINHRFSVWQWKKELLNEFEALQEPLVSQSLDV